MGGLAAFLAITWLQSQTRETAEAKGTIVVAASHLAVGVTLTDKNIAELPWAATERPDGAFATKSDVLKDGRRVVMTSLEHNEPVLRSKITAPGQPGSLSSLLEAGKRAVTVRVDDVRGVAGFIRPNDRVDVVLIRSEKNGQSYSDLILQGVKVLAVDQLTGERTEQPTVAKVVTLEVTAEEAQKVVLSENIGKLSLILRQAGADISAESRRVTEGDLALMDTPRSGKSVVAPPPEAPEPKAEIPTQRPETTNVGVVRGMKRDEYTVIQDTN